MEAYFQQWARYIDLSIRKRGDVVIDIGYTIPESSFDWLQREMPDIQIMVKKKEKG